MEILDKKDPALRQLVNELLSRMPPINVVLVDRWETDPGAIGIALATQPGRLVYVHSERDLEGHYYMARELPPDGEQLHYRDAGEDNFGDLDQLAAAVAKHLSAA